MIFALIDMLRQGCRTLQRRNPGRSADLTGEPAEGGHSRVPRTQRERLRHRASRFPAWLPLLPLLLLFPMASAGEKRPVFVTASFVDKNGLFIEDLEKGEVEIFEKGQPRPIEFMAKDELPVNYGLLFDKAMIPEFTEDERRGPRSISSAAYAKDIAYQLIDRHLGRQAVWVAAYERELQVVQDIAADGFRAKAAIQRIRGRRNPGDSFLYAALFSAIQKMNGQHEKRRVLILFLDTLDNETAGKLKLLKNLLSSANVELFMISFASRMGSTRGGLQPAMSMSALKDLSKVTSGTALFQAEYGDHPEDLVRRVYNHIRTYYTFGFESQSGPGNAVELAIKCRRPESKVRHHPVVPAF